MFGFSRFEILGAVAALIAIITLPWALLAEGRAHHARAEAVALHARIEAPVTGYIAQLERAEGNRLRLEASVGAQNAAIDAWKAEADRLKIEGVAQLAAARREGAARLAASDRILAARPNPGETQCAAAERLILESLS